MLHFQPKLRVKLIPFLPLQGRPKAAGSYDEPTIDPAIFCSAFRRNRFYIFSRREPREAGYQNQTFTARCSFI